MNDQEKSKSPERWSRRDFHKLAVTGSIGVGLGATKPVSIKQTVVKPRINIDHHVGGDYHVVMCDEDLNWSDRQKVWTNTRNLQYHQRHGVRHMTNSMQGIWNLDEMKKWKDDCDRESMVWEAIRMDSGFIYASSGDEQKEKLQVVIDNVRKAAAVGVKVITMHWTLIPIRRNSHRPGRGGSSYHSFELEKDWQQLPNESHGIIKYDEYWRRITYFLENIIPVCEEYDVRMAVHPYDPPGLPRGYQGVDNWDAAPDGIFDSLKKYESIVDSPYNGFQICLGTIMEGLKNPAVEILPIVKYFAEKGKIYQIHMRNIKGGLYNFEEVYIDEGEANFIEVVKILRDSGYTWSICPDHVPTHPDDPRGYQAFAHAFGYIKSLIDSANAEVKI